MQILFAISILCFFAIVWAALAFARHIKAGSVRRNDRQELSILSPQPEFRQHLYAAAESDTPRARPDDLHQRVRDITANKSWNMPPRSDYSRRSTVQLPRIGSRDQKQSTRKPPQAARHGAMAFLDSAYFSKDAGDLTDPYQPPKIRANESNISTKRY